MSKEVDLIKKCSDSAERCFIYSAEADESYSLKYNYFPDSVKMHRFQSGEYGTVSDTYILYMLTLLGNVSVETIENMLEAYSRNYKNLLIAQKLITSSSSKQSHVESRIKVLLKNGFVFSQNFDIGRPDGMFDKIVLYGVGRDTQTFMNRKLGKNVVMRPWEMAIPLNDAISEAASAFVASIVALKGGCRLKSIKEDAFKSKEMGTVLLPPTLFLDGTSELEKYQVLFYPAFLNHVSFYQTDGDFERTIKYKMDCVRNYIYMYRNVSRKPFCIFVCESGNDMEKVRKVLQQLRQMQESLPFIYFTSEGAVRYISNLRDAFLQIRPTGDGELVYVKATPPFIKAN